ncbi:MAG: DUF262 domain-containing protein [Candidatus Adiutrix sp.]
MPTKKQNKSTSDIDISVPQELTDTGAFAGVEQEANVFEFPFDANKIDISSVPVPISRLIERLKRKTISTPPIQRLGDLWSGQQQSRLIESLMLRIPLPLFYVAADRDENWKIVDGLQRVSALQNFLVKKSLALTKLEFLTDLNKKKYDDLPPKYKNRILDTTLQFAVISSSTPPEVQRNVFKRLNTGGLPLSAQEIRHALCYDEKSAALLHNLANSKAFKEATDNSINDSRMAAKELVLRFIAFLIRDIDTYPSNGDMDSFLSDTMLLLNAMPELNPEKLKKFFYPRKISPNCKYKTHASIQKLFILAMERAKKLFGIYAFRKSLPPSPKRTPVSKAIFEAVAITLCKMEESHFNRLVSRKKQFFTNLKKHLDGDLGAACSRATNTKANIKKRFNGFEKILKEVSRG